MFDRGGILSEIEALVERIADGHGGTLILSGEGGIGKTRLLTEAVDRASPRMRVARAQGEAMESGIAFGLVAQLLADLDAGGLLEDGDEAAPAAHVRAAQFFGALGRLESSARDRPLLLAVDDLHWTDPDSLALLGFVCRRIAGLPIGVIATLRPWPPAARDAALNLEEHGQASVARVLPLGLSSATLLLADRCGRQIAPEVASRAWSATAGNPLLLEQVARAVCDGRYVPDLGDLRLPTHSETLLLTRFAGIGRRAMSFARAASALGVGFRPDLAAEVGRLDADDEHDAIEALVGSGLVQSDADGMSFAHPLFAQAVYETLPDAIRRILHRRAFDALVGRGLAEEAAEHAVRADLVGDIRAVDVLIGVGEDALRAGAVNTAIGRLQAADALRGTAAVTRLGLALGTALLEAGRAAEAVAAAGRAVETAGTGSEAAAFRLLGLAEYANGDHDAAAISFDRAVGLAEADQPEVAVSSLLVHAVLISLTRGPTVALRELVRARSMTDRLDAGLRLRVEGTWGYVAVLGGDAAGYEGVAAAADALAADPNPRSVRRAWRELTMYGAAAKYLEHLDEAEVIYARSVAIAHETESAAAVAALCTGHGETLVRMGRLDEALRATDRACAVAEFATHVTAALATVNRAHILLLAGRVTESVECIDRAEAMAHRGRGAWLPLLRVLDLRGQVRLRDGRAAQAADVYRRALEIAVDVGLGEPCVVPWAGHAVAAHLACGDIDQAERVIAWLDDCVAGLPCRWPRIAVATGRGLIAERGGEHERAEAEFERALALHEAVDLPVDLVETLLAWGAFLRRRGRLVRARQVLRHACADAEAIGAVWFAEQAQTELGLAGGRRRRRDDPDTLSEAERRVARLANAGLTNREIADQLCISANTVGTHLRRVYDKLGIHSRHELLRAAGGGRSRE
ncbi:MAG TPA: AAA family ATPase [Solirubrobacteraceae bacterium]|jgi:DNA-binding CsgD family transcriptional regulator|nr:AAA family ATPase [Solirubrobacteraceae bacterium]